ncbi:MAG TPA: calcium-binding protein [Solirubrobacterales bacterium]|jgi:Ca2+-binding RTX toxin-like protein|nr:calcium-binding protein [Solirubrobacterales bacterium]
MATDNRSLRRKPVKKAWVVAGTGALTLLLAGTALGAPTNIPKTATGVHVSAAPGTVNHIAIRYGVFEQGTDGFHVDAHYISDTAGLTVVEAEGQICTQPVANTTACVDTGTTAGIPNGSTGTGEDPTIKLGDRDDTLVSDNVGSLQVIGGPGDDTMKGGSRPVVDVGFEGEPGFVDPSSESFRGQGGNDVLKGFAQPDLLNGGKGNDKIDGGKGRDDLYGGGGRDRLNAKDGQRDASINCGPGNDSAKVDKIDPRPVSC